ncbi:hypothetical protein [Nocardia sp. NPDC049149]
MTPWCVIHTVPSAHSAVVTYWLLAKFVRAADQRRKSSAAVG